MRLLRQFLTLYGRVQAVFVRSLDADILVELLVLMLAQRRVFVTLQGVDEGPSHVQQAQFLKGAPPAQVRIGHLVAILEAELLLRAGVANAKRHQYRRSAILASGAAQEQLAEARQLEGLRDDLLGRFV